MTRMRGGWVGLVVALLAAIGCGGPVAGDPGDGGGDGPDAGAPVAHHIEVTIDGLQPGWLVTTSRLTGDQAPADITQVSDGSAITLDGSDTDVFVTTVTDADGTLVEAHTMGSPCTLAPAHRLRVPGDYPAIQAAVDAADPGDTVLVAPGTYTESIAMRPGVCLIGSGAVRTVLDAGGESRSLVDLTDAPGAVVAGFTMRGVAPGTGCADADPFTCSGDWYRAAVYLGGTRWDDPTADAPPLIADNVFEGNDIGVLLYWRGISVVRNNVFVGNRNGLVANHFQSRTLVANNVFFGNDELAIGNQAAYLDIVNNVIARSALGIRFEYIQTGFIRCNLFFGNGADQNDDRFQIGHDGNLSGDPHFLDATGHDFHLGDGSPGHDHGCFGGHAFEPDGTPDDIGAYGGPLASWVEL
jgi:Periplasmic copper-binding protein (NosD)